MRQSVQSILLWTLVACSVAADQDLLSVADAAWERRSESRLGDFVAPAAIDEAIFVLEQVVGQQPAELEPYWKLMRALYFKGDYTPMNDEDKLALYDRGKTLFETALGLLAEVVGGRKKLEQMDPEAVARALRGAEHAAAIYNWGAVHWGKWGENTGKLAAVRQGVAKRLRRYAEIVIALDESFDNASGHRMLGRLHTEAPRVPLFTGWVDRDVAVNELERAVELAPDELQSRLFLAEALLKFRPGERSRAVQLVQELVEREPHPDRLAEEERTLASAMALLAQIEAEQE